MMGGESRRIDTPAAPVENGLMLRHTFPAVVILIATAALSATAVEPADRIIRGGSIVTVEPGPADGRGGRDS